MDAGGQSPFSCFYMLCCRGPGGVGWGRGPGQRRPLSPTPCKTYLHGAHAPVCTCTLRGSWWGHHFVHLHLISCCIIPSVWCSGARPLPQLNFGTSCSPNFYKYAILHVWHTFGRKPCHSPSFVCIIHHQHHRVHHLELHNIPYSAKPNNVCVCV